LEDGWSQTGIDINIRGKAKEKLEKRTTLPAFLQRIKGFATKRVRVEQKKILLFFVLPNLGGEPMRVGGRTSAGECYHVFLSLFSSS
jgi:hypothetical protein